MHMHTYMHIPTHTRLSREHQFLSSCLGVSKRVLVFIKIQRQALYNFKVQLTCSKSVQDKSHMQPDCRRLVEFEPGCLGCKTFFCKNILRQESNPWGPTESLMAQSLHHPCIPELVTIPDYWRLYINIVHKLSYMGRGAAGPSLREATGARMQFQHWMSWASGKPSRFDSRLNLPQATGPRAAWLAWPGK